MGARWSPAFPEPGNECIALYGDSFTYGDEVGHAETWGNVLSEMLNCRIANYGVGGYGTDQALLRFISQENDTSKLVILGIYPHNIMRNVNQLRFFMTGRSPLSLKPRYILENNALRLVEIPKLTFADFKRSFERPSEFYQHETFLAGSAAGWNHRAYYREKAEYRLGFVQPMVLEEAVSDLKEFARARQQVGLVGRPGSSGAGGR